MAENKERKKNKTVISGGHTWAGIDEYQVGDLVAYYDELEKTKYTNTLGVVMGVNIDIFLGTPRSYTVHWMEGNNTRIRGSMLPMAPKNLRLVSGIG